MIYLSYSNLFHMLIFWHGVLSPICLSAVLHLHIINWYISCRWAKCQAHFNICSGRKCAKHTCTVLLGTMCWKFCLCGSQKGLQWERLASYMLQMLLSSVTFATRLWFHREGKVVLWIQMAFGRSGSAYSLSVATKNKWIFQYIFQLPCHSAGSLRIANFWFFFFFSFFLFG